MATLKDVPLRIPDQWSASWFRTFVVEVLSKADVRNVIGEGVTVTVDGNSVATLTIDPTGAIADHNADPFSHGNLVAAHTSESDPHTQYLLRSDVIDGGTP